jgi:hypothetical protein
MGIHLEVNWGQGAYRPAHPPGAPSAAVPDRPALCSLSQARSHQSVPLHGGYRLARRGFGRCCRLRTIGDGGRFS